MLKERILLVLSILVIAFSVVVIYFKMEYITRKELKVIILKDLSTKKENLNNYKVKFLKEGEKYTPCMEHITVDMVLNKIKENNLL